MSISCFVLLGIAFSFFFWVQSSNPAMPFTQNYLHPLAI